MHRLVSRSGTKGLSFANNEAARTAKLIITRDLPGACSISTAEPVRAPGKHAFSVAMPVKGVRTAIGFLGMAEPSARYMTPDYLSGAGAPYVSMGGAGFIYPAKASASCTYGEGDTVRCQIDFDASVVSFFVNGRPAGQAAWTGSDFAFPAISVFPGALEANFTFK